MKSKWRRKKFPDISLICGLDTRKWKVGDEGYMRLHTGNTMILIKSLGHFGGLEVSTFRLLTVNIIIDM